MKDMYYSQQNGIVLLILKRFHSEKKWPYLSPPFSITDRQFYCQVDSYKIMSFLKMLRNVSHSR